MPAADQPASTAAPVSKPGVTVTSITFEGDSTIYGIGGDGHTEPDYVNDILHVSVINAGVSGSTAGENINGVVTFTTQLATRLALDPSQIVVMNYGINDSYKASIDIYKQNLIDWVTIVRSFGKVPVFEEPNPSSIASFQAAMPQYVEAMDEAAAKLNVPIVKQYDYMMSLPNWERLLYDGLHPNAQGYQIKAERTAAVLKTVIAGMK